MADIKDGLGWWYDDPVGPELHQSSKRPLSERWEELLPEHRHILTMAIRTLENNLALVKAEAEGLGSLLLDVQQDSIAATKKLAEAKDD